MINGHASRRMVAGSIYPQSRRLSCPFAGRRARRVLDNVDDAGWSPDGRELAFVRFSTVVPNVGTEVASPPCRMALLELSIASPTRCFARPRGARRQRYCSGRAASRKCGEPRSSVHIAVSDGKDVREVRCPLTGGELSAATWPMAPTASCTACPNPARLRRGTRYYGGFCRSRVNPEHKDRQGAHALCCPGARFAARDRGSRAHHL